MTRASPDGVEITGPLHERYDEVLTPGALRSWRRSTARTTPGAASCSRPARPATPTSPAGGTLDFLAETKDVREDETWRVADPAPGLEDRRWRSPAPPTAR